MSMNDWLLPAAHKDRESITKDWSPVGLKLIDGIQIKEVRPVMTGYGHLTEVLRGEWIPGNAHVDQIFVSTLLPGGLSAWHAHEKSTDRLFVVAGHMRMVFYDARENSPTRGLINEFRSGVQRPMLIVVPPRVWHGVQNYGNTPAVLLNAVDKAYSYENPDHWRVPPDSESVPYTFPALGRAAAG